MRILPRLLRFFLPLVILGVAVFAAVTMIRNRPQVETQLPEVAPPGVRVHWVALDTIRVSVRSQGTIRPRTETQLVPEITGRVTWVSPSFAEGGFFEQDEILLRIDPFDYEQAVVSARSQLAQARLRLAQEEAEAEVAEREWASLGRGDPRALTLRKPQLEDARASVAAAEANVLRAQRDLERAEVRAPYAGRVRAKSVDLGQFVTVGNPIATVYAVDIAEVRLPLPDGELAYLDLPLAYRGGANRPGPPVKVLATFAGAVHEWRGRIVRTESEIDPVSRMVHVVAEVNDPYAPGPDPNRPPLAVGMFVEAEIDGRAFDNIAVLPRAALRGRDEVLVVDSESRVRFRTIEIQRATTESIYVSGGLAPGEWVAVSALDAPTDGMLVQVTDVENDEAADLEPGQSEQPTASGASAGQDAESAAASVASEPVAAGIPPSSVPSALEAVEVTAGDDGSELIVMLRGSGRLHGGLREIPGVPFRVFVDLMGVVPDLPAVTPVGWGNVEQIRTALNQPHPPVTRVVLDLSSPQPYRLDEDTETTDLRIVIGGASPAPERNLEAPP